MDNSEIWVDRKDFKDTTIVTTELGRHGKSPGPDPWQY